MLILSFILLFSGMPIAAAETEDSVEWFEMQEGEEDDCPQAEITNPYNLYLNDVVTYIEYAGDYDIKLRAEVYCASTVAEIYTIFYLQKLYSNTWKTVSQGTATKSNSNYMYKNMYVNDVTAGTYRCKTSTQVTSSSGYTETMASYTASITIN